MSPANRTTPPYSSTIAAVRSSTRAEAASCSRRRINLCPLLLGRRAESSQCALGDGDGVPRIFFIGQGYAGDHFAVGRLDNVHDFAAVAFHECSIDVVFRDCLHWD